MESMQMLASVRTQFQKVLKLLVLQQWKYNISNVWKTLVLFKRVSIDVYVGRNWSAHRQARLWAL